MGQLIAVSGKGGVGKTTVSALIVRQLLKGNKTPVLAIDADPNSCLDAALGQRVVSTIGSVREETKEEAAKGAVTGVSKQEMLRLKIAESIVEASGFDILAMGRPEGPGCYCYANNVLKAAIGEISGQYPYVVLDNEAGLENLSRRIVQALDVLVMVSDPSNAGLGTLMRLYDLSKEMQIQYRKLVIIINRIRNGLPSRMEEIASYTHADLIVGLPDDAELASFAEEGRSFLEIEDDNRVLALIDTVLDQNL